MLIVGIVGYCVIPSHCQIMGQSIENIDFSFLDSLVSDKRIVAIGESSHGIGDYFSLKTKMVKYLHEHLGFEVLAMEAGLGDTNLGWSRIDDLDAQSLRNSTLFRNFKCKEINNLFEYIKKERSGEQPLIYSGFDVQFSSDNLTNHLDEILQYIGNDLTSNLDAGFEAYYKIYPAAYQEDSIEFITYRDQFVHHMTIVKDAIYMHSDAVQNVMGYSAWEMQMITRSLEGLIKSFDFNYAQRFNDENLFTGIVRRDELMAKNLQWLLEEIYPDKKFIIWGHNAHVQSGGLFNRSTQWMGQIVKQKYPNDYYAIGLFAYSGDVYQHWTKERISFENSGDRHIESKMLQKGMAYHFLDVDRVRRHPKYAWLSAVVDASEIENAGVVTFKPIDRFDAIMTLTSVKSPTFD